MTGCSGTSLFRYALSLAVVAWTLISCSGGGSTPPSTDALPFVINSPQAGSRIAGTVFFSAQPFDPSEVSSVSFTAGTTDLGTDTTPADGFKVFLSAKDFSAGALTLSATVQGRNGATSSRSVTVANVPSPPSTATVTADGAALGTTEANGALSTLVIPAGAKQGASVGFEAQTKEEVKTATGVDYDALGVTFLGAQEVTSSDALQSPLMVTSGGFGPMVQPEQVVVNYMITPDADGDGVGELMVINSASVAPNGDVISDPVPQIQLGAATATDGSGTRTLRTLQAGTVSGPPGTFINVEATGFNAFSVLGNVALFKSSVDGSEIELPAVVNNHYEEENAVPTVGFYIPLLPAGAATVTLRNVSTNETTDPISITVEAAPALSDEPAVVIDKILADVIATLSSHPDLAEAVSQFEEARALFADLNDDPTPEEAQALRDIAGFMANSNIRELLGHIEAGNSGSLTVQQCSLGGFGEAFATYSLGTVLMGLGLTLGAISILAGNPIFVVVTGIMTGRGIRLSFKGTSKISGAINQCLDPPLPPLTPSPRYCTPPTRPVPPPATPSPEGVRAQQLPTPSTVTGMGSVVPPGGDSCGSAVGGGAGASASRHLQTRHAGSNDILGDLAGRFIVKVFYGAGNAVPFTGVSDSSGYFYIPLVPAGQPFEAIAFDTLTGETHSFEGTGPEVGQSTYMFFDFLSEGDGGADVLGYDSNTEGVLGDVDIYLFEGRAGDLINLAVFSVEVNLNGIDFQLNDPNGFGMISGLATGGHYFDTGFIELELDGLYSFTLDGSKTNGAYTLGLAEIAPPTPLDIRDTLHGDLGALGDHHLYSFTGSVGDLLDVTLSHDAASNLNAELIVREPRQGFPFDQWPRRIRLFTNDVQRSRSGTHTLAVTGDYMLELTYGDHFAESLDKFLGGYQVELSLTP